MCIELVVDSTQQTLRRTSTPFNQNKCRTMLICAGVVFPITSGEQCATHVFAQVPFVSSLVDQNWLPATNVVWCLPFLGMSILLIILNRWNWVVARWSENDVETMNSSLTEKSTRNWKCVISASCRAYKVISFKKIPRKFLPPNGFEACIGKRVHWTSVMHW